MKQIISLWHRILATILSAVIVFSLICFFPVQADEKTNLENQIRQLEEKEKELKKELAAASTDLSASRKRKEILDSQIDNVTEQINLQSEQLSEINKAIAKKNEQIEQTKMAITLKEAAIAQKHRELGLRLRSIAKKGNFSTIQLLFNIDNYKEYLLKSKAMHCIAARDQKAMDEVEKALDKIKEEKIKLDSEKEDVEAQKKELVSLKTASDKKKHELDTLCAASRSEITKLEGTVDGFHNDIAANKKKIEEANEAIEQLIESSQNHGVYDRNKMFWPVPTVRNISSGYGRRWGRMHWGIDISEGKIPIYGENIVAAADGVVIASNYTSKWGSGWSYGYGYSCIVDHGRDKRGIKIATLYAHMSVNNARVGQKVTGGKTVLGRAGRTGDVTGPHLHFEVRENGYRVNPYPKYVKPNVN